jgi:predicted RNase H-like nuclease
MTTILALDAAWTDSEPSGVALLAANGSRWRCLCVTPSYGAFIDCARGTPIKWHGSNFRGSRPNVPDLLRAARAIAGGDVDLVAVDMPIATMPFSARRAADNAISVAFGGRGCAAHSPSAQRPGALGAELSGEICKAGYQLTTTIDDAKGTRKLIEVYPHPALLALLRASYRIPNKVQESSKYWPGIDVRGRIARLLSRFANIHAAVKSEIDGVTFSLPTPGSVSSLSSLKRYEDALDALVCGWVAAQFALGKAIPYGDATAAVWVPKVDHLAAPIPRLLRDDVV